MLRIRDAVFSGISIHVPREGDDAGVLLVGPFLCVISIHVPREGDDRWNAALVRRAAQISIHVPREGDDLAKEELPEELRDFNPRPP